MEMRSSSRGLLSFLKPNNSHALPRENTGAAANVEFERNYGLIKKQPGAFLLRIA